MSIKQYYNLFPPQRREGFCDDEWCRRKCGNVLHLSIHHRVWDGFHISNALLPIIPFVHVNRSRLLFSVSSLAVSISKAFLFILFCPSPSMTNSTEYGRHSMLIDRVTERTHPVKLAWYLQFFCLKHLHASATVVSNKLFMGTMPLLFLVFLFIAAGLLHQDILQFFSKNFQFSSFLHLSVGAFCWIWCCKVALLFCLILGSHFLSECV